jgi:peptide/nickel transport system substrate-binding protein
MAPVAKEEVAARRGGVLNWTPSATIANLDPIRNTAFVTRSVTHQFYDYPFGLTKDYKSAPQMVSEWSVTEDATEYTFTLRENLAFHDGSPVEAGDVISSVLRWKTGVGGPSRVWGLAGEPDLEVVNPSTLKIRPTTPFGLWVNYWGFFGTPIMPKEAADALAFEDVNTDYRGSGPYKFDEWVPGAKVRLVNNEAYVPRDEAKNGSAGGRIPYLDAIEYIEVPDSATRVAALQTNQTDLVTDVPSDYYDTLDKDPRIVVKVLKPHAKQEAAINKTVKPLNNPKARLAVQAITDVEKYMEAAFGRPELYVLCPALFFCGTQWASEVGAELYWEVDVEKGRRLWAEAMAEENYDGKIVVLANTDIPSLYNRALLLKEDLEALGADVEFAVSDWATLISRKIANLGVDPQEDPSRGWHFYQTGDEGARDPVSDAATGTSWNGGWGNEEGYALAEKWTKATSYEEAKGYVDEIQRIYYYEDPSLIVYGYSSWLAAMQNYVMDWEPHSVLTIDGLWLDQ